MTAIPHSARCRLAAGAGLALLLAAGCAARQDGLPGWVERPPADDAFLYGVGVSTGAPTLEAARQGAIEQAIGELARRFGVTSETSYAELRTQLETQVRDEIRSRSGSVRIDGAIVQESLLRQTRGGYEAFVLLRYPRRQAERERARLAALDASVLHAAAQAKRRGDEARARGDAGAAIAAYLEAASCLGDSASAVALRTEVSNRLSAIASGLRLEVVGGDHQPVRPFSPLPEPVRVRAWLGEQPAAGLPIRIAAPPQVGGEAAGGRTDANGTVDLIVPPLQRLPADRALGIMPDVAALRPNGGRLDDSSEGILRAVAARGTVVHLDSPPASRPVRIAVLIDERRGGVRRRRSLLAVALVERLNRAGFRVVADHELGKSNLDLLRRAVDPSLLRSVDPELAAAVDVVVGGWCETRPGSDNRGWAISVLADAEVRAVDVASGEVLAAQSLIGRAGFGERADRAEVDAVRAVADAVTAELAVELGGETDAWGVDTVEAGVLPDEDPSPLGAGQP